jgi:hypothetical protein
MTTDQIIALIAGIPTIIGAITALIVALRAKTAATHAVIQAGIANNALSTHIVHEHNKFPIQPPTQTSGPPLPPPDVTP